MLIKPGIKEETNPLQQEFNDLILQLEDYDHKLEKARLQMDEKLRFTAEYLLPFRIKLSRLDMEFIFSLYRCYKDWNISKTKRELFAMFILEKIEDCFFEDSGLDEKEKDSIDKIYDDLHIEAYGTDPYEQSEQDELNAEEIPEDWFNELKSVIENNLKSEGIKIDLSGLHNKMSNEEIADYIDKQQVENGSFKSNGKNKHSKSKKSKKQAEKEMLEEQMQELKNQNISSIFKKIAKVIHPDLELDPESKLRKEEIMKQLTAAYEKRDLRAMLRLEMEWVIGEKDKLDKLTDDKLRVFIELLIEQLTELKKSIQEIGFHSRYQAMHLFSDFQRDLNKWKPAKSLKNMQVIFIKNSMLLDKIKINNRQTRNYIDECLEEFKKSAFYF